MSIQNSTMLVGLSISQWGASKVDKEATKKVIEDSGAEADAGRFTKRLVPKSYLKELGANASQLRAVHYHYTLPWQDDGTRILPTALYETFRKEVHDLIMKREVLASEFASKRPLLVDAAKRRLGKMFNEAEFPTEEQLRSEFQVRVRVLPMPSASDFRVDLPKAEVREIQARIEAQLASTYSDAVKTAYQRIGGVMRRIQKRLSDPEAKFKNSLIENVRELCELLPAFNITNDPELAKLTEVLAKDFGTKDPNDLRHNLPLRRRVANKAQAVLNSIDDKLGL